MDKATHVSTGDRRLYAPIGRNDQKAVITMAPYQFTASTQLAIRHASSLLEQDQPINYRDQWRGFRDWFDQMVVEDMETPVFLEEIRFRNIKFFYNKMLLMVVRVGRTSDDEPWRVVATGICPWCDVIAKEAQHFSIVWHDPFEQHFWGVPGVMINPVTQKFTKA